MLRRLRAVPGLEQVPLFGVFDLHANLTEAMTRLADGLVCYRENPHIDARDTAVRAAELLARCLATGKRPRMLRRSVPIIWPPTGTGTADLPMRDLEALAREIEAADPEIWAVNVVAGFSFADVADAGVAFSVVTTGDDRTAEAALDRLADAGDGAQGAWPRTGDHAGRRARPGRCLRRARAGASRRALRQYRRRRARQRHRRSSARWCAAASTMPASSSTIPRQSPRSPTCRSGAARPCAIGGKDNPFDAGPLVLEVELVHRSDGRFDLEDLHSHLIASQGRHIDMGPSAVVRHRGITILITTHRTPPNDLGQWRSQGIDPEDFAVIGIKAGVAHRRAYDPIAAASFNVATPGPCTSDPAALPYRRLRRPIFPLDPL